jgi:hypothetical protein
MMSCGRCVLGCEEGPDYPVETQKEKRPQTLRYTRSIRLLGNRKRREFQAD